MLLRLLKTCGRLRIRRPASKTFANMDEDRKRIEPRSTEEGSEESRLSDLMQALQRIAKFQNEAALSQVNTRQKMREVGFARRDVWVSDAKFMREVQRILSEKDIEELKALSSLADECQAARDILGPLEQEGIEAEMSWEGVIWKLREEEVKLYTEFKSEFEKAATYSQPSSTDDTSSYHHSLPEDESDHEPGGNRLVFTDRLSESIVSAPASTSSFDRANINVETSLNTDTSHNVSLLGLAEPEVYSQQANILSCSSDSGVGDIDHLSDPGSIEDSSGPPQPLPLRDNTSTELYSSLLTDFGSRRDRINKWLQHTSLLSHQQATIIRNQLSTKFPSTPSNWAQLVIAYWELDDAAIPQLQYSDPADQTLNPHQRQQFKDLTSTGPAKKPANPPL